MSAVPGLPSAEQTVRPAGWRCGWRGRYRLIAELTGQVERLTGLLPGEGHGHPERAHQADVLERVRAWFTRWLAGA